MVYQIRHSKGYRVVCRNTFRRHFPLSRPTFYRLEAERRSGVLEPYSTRAKQYAKGTGNSWKPGINDASSTHVSRGSLCVSWLLTYAAQNSELIPDVDIRLLPYRKLSSMHREYVADHEAAKRLQSRLAPHEAGHDVDTNVCSEASQDEASEGLEPQLKDLQPVTVNHFRELFNHHPLLKQCKISNSKCNFGRCTICRKGEQRIRKAAKSNNPQDLVLARFERHQHLLGMRLEKVSYYFEREMARSPVGLKITLIIDKVRRSILHACARNPHLRLSLLAQMDSNKNIVPCFTGRLPKDMTPNVADHLLVMHVVGVIIHGNPDKRYFFLAYPHLAGNSNLNLECIRLALVQYGKDTGYSLRPNLYIQFDNASDNKSRFVIGGLAWLLLKDLVNQVEMVMLPVGHTQ